MKYLIFCISSIIITLFIEHKVMKRKKVVPNETVEAKYLKALHQIEELKNKIKDVANEETPTTIADIMSDLN